MKPRVFKHLSGKRWAPWAVGCDCAKGFDYYRTHAQAFAAALMHYGWHHFRA